MPKLKEFPKMLRAYVFHGVDLNSWEEGDEQALATCPFCRKDGKFSVEVETGLWHCKTCAAASDKSGGNTYTFLRALWETSMNQKNMRYEGLVENRKLLNADALVSWGICRSALIDDWLVPGFGVDGKLNQLYRYVRDYESKRMTLLPTPGINQQLHGINLWDASKDFVYICEGPWDGVAALEVLKSAKADEKGNLFLTSNEDASLFGNANVIAVPGCKVFAEAWTKIFAGKKVVLLYDNDYPRTNNGKTFKAGYDGMKRVAQLLAWSEEPPDEIHYLAWSATDGYDKKLPDGFDVRDHLAAGGMSMSGRVKQLEKLLGKIQPIPEDWVEGRSKAAAKRGNVELECVPCDSWSELINEWRKAMKWTDGLENALAAMLACTASTMIVGDQLWIKIIGPASCIAEGVKINYVIREKKTGRLINKKGGPIERLFARFNGMEQDTNGAEWKKAEDVDFFVQSVKDDGWVFRNKIKDVVYNGTKEVFEIRTSSGKKLRATADHEIWTDEGYKQLKDLVVGSLVMVNNGVTKKKGGISKSPYRKEVLVKYHPRARVKIISGIRYQRMTVYRAAYEAFKNKMEYADYIKLLNSGDKGKIDKLWIIPDGFDIHHKDENFKNDSPKNLVMIKPGDHSRLHGEKAAKHVAIYAEPEKVVSIKSVGRRPVYDIVCEDPYRNFVAGGIVVHNCGKSTLCEALSVNKKYVAAKSTIRGFYSGFKTDAKGEQDNSLVVQLSGKTLVTKDGDTLLQSPNKDQILSEARDLYDCTGRTHYRNAMGKDYQGLRITWILCGTSSLRQIDSSELGERFLDVVIMDGIDDDLEDEILWRVVNRVHRSMSLEANGKLETQYDPDLVRAMQLTGGYVSYLRENARDLLAAIQVSDDVLLRLTKLGKFVSYMRARPSLKQDESAEREFAARLVSQLTRMAMCMAIAFGKKELDEDVLARVTKIAMDTARGRTLEIVKNLHRVRAGAETKFVANWTNQSEDKERTLLRFLKRIGVVDTYRPQVSRNAKSANVRWILTKRIRRLYEDVMGIEPTPDVEENISALHGGGEG